VRCLLEIVVPCQVVIILEFVNCTDRQSFTFHPFNLVHTTTMGLETTTNPPTTVSREEHTTLTSSTPQSFGDIPPILRFEDNVEITLSQGEGSSPVSIDGRVRGKLWVTEQ
jgi:hypothetical protein